MARRRPVDPEAIDGALIMPKDVLLSPDWRARNEWLRAHGVDTTKWDEIRRVEDATRAAYGIEITPRRRLQVGGSLERARLRAEGITE